MSGGFFRGTSADQDTRFSNKQAKLLKSQKFAPELDHLVDISKVKMDVVKPWIAARVTEFLGFEDEVLINFIYGLLDGKEINGKEVQIQLTGFMEKNTGKFMKELWNLLRSAEQNASGVPQQFLDAKEEEIRKRKEEADRITLEIQMKRGIEQEKAKEMDGKDDKMRSLNDGFNPLPKRLPPVGEEDIVSEESNGSRGINRLSRSPHSAQRGPSPQLKQSRSMSRSPPRRRSISPDRRYRSPIRRSISPRRRHRSPLRRRSPYSRRRSASRSWRRSPSPVRRRSPFPARRRSPSPARRRSPSPVRRRSPIPVRRRSPSPSRRRSPTLVRRRSPFSVRRRSPPPMRRRSPSPRRHRSPSPFQRRSHRRSPTPRRRSPSPFRRRPPSPLGSISPPRRSLSPISPKESKMSPLRSQQRNRSRSPYRSRSPVYQSRRSLSRDREIQTNGVGSKRIRDDYPSQRARGKRSPVRHTPEREVDMSNQEHKTLDPELRRPPVPLRSPHRDPQKQSGGHHKVPVHLRSPEKSPSGSESPPHMRKVIFRDGKRAFSPSGSPVRVTREQRSRAESASPARKIRDEGARHRGSPETSGEEDNSRARHVCLSSRKRTRLSPAAHAKVNVPSRNTHDEEYSPEDSARDQSGDARCRHADNLESRKKDRDLKSERASVMAERPGRNTQNISSHSTDVVAHGRVEGEKSKLDGIPDEQPFSKKRSRSSNFEGSERAGKLEALQKPTKRIDHQIATSDSDSEENEKYRIGGVDKRKQKKSEKHQMASGNDASDDSQIDTKKEAKRRRKEEKRMRKEEKRRRREERHRKKVERRAGRLKSKSKDTVPSEIKKSQKFGDDDFPSRRESHPSDTEEYTEIDPKQHEIELRMKALESLRAKKAVKP